MDINTKSRELVKLIYNHDYYVNRFEYVLNSNHMKKDELILGNYDKIKVIQMWNDFWLALPDSPTIHRTPFNELCDLCENIFGSEE